MDLFWNDRLKVGHATIDEQHRQLFAAFAAFIDACEKRRGQAQLQEVFTFLNGYTRTHFAAEEELMAAHGFLGLAAHQEQHRRFIVRLDDLQQEMATSGPTIKVLIGTTKALVYWLTEHIRDVDTRLAGFLSSSHA
ncbi:MAG: hypothetical protein A2091_02675 [Desulfuromonadales bacterium GWD2_61_12]|nr:MAG: hypothetical protein A2091_02675 [Desulfuromonadales bacterium GWD2_61_12]HAD04904.1 hemerythrin [Desulfuromonas sp.]